MKHSPLVILSAYTGFLLCKFSDLHAYIEEVLGRPVFTHELGNKDLVKEISDKVRERGDFNKALETIENSLETAI